MDINTLKVAAQYGIGGVIAALLVFVLGKILWKIGLRMIGAIDAMRLSHEANTQRIADRFEQLADRFDSHTRADVEALKSVQLSVANLDGKFDAVLDKLDRTPVHGVPIDPELRAKTPPTGVPIGPQHKRGRTNG